MNLLLPLIPGNLPIGFCPTSEQERLNAYMQVSSAQLAGGLAFYNFGDTKPAPELQGFPWLRTTDGRWYVYSGVWRAPNNYDLNERRLWYGDLTQLITYDGGSAGPVSPEGGPMWVEATECIGRSIMHPGIVPTTNPSKTLGVGESYGEGAHALVATEVPASITLSATLVGWRTNLESGGPQWLAPSGSSGAALTTPATAEGSFIFTNTGGGQAHQTVHPVLDVYLIKPSGRQYYVVP